MSKNVNNEAVNNEAVNNEAVNNEAENKVPVDNEAESTAVVVSREDVASVGLIAQLQRPSDSFYCSIKDDGTRKSKVAIYNAINNAEESLNDHIGEVLEVTEVVAYPAEFLDTDTGEMLNGLRTVLITKDGNAYSAMSQGITNSLARIFNIIGMPSWAVEPVKMKVKQVKTRNGNNKVNILELVD